MENNEIVNYLAGFVTENRFNTFLKVINLRTKYLTVVLEDIFQSHNASAVVRSCDCFGIQDIHIIENRNQYTVNPDVALGSTKWLNMHKYNEKENNTLDAINKLKSNNYRIVATTPDSKNTNLDKFNLENGKIALVFGSEMPGVSKTIIDNADEFLYIPMYGLTESFNISVSVAICLYDLSNRLRNSKIKWELKSKEKEIVQGNYDMWEAIIDNMLNNFVRYADQKIRITIRKNEIIFYNDGPNIETTIVHDLFTPYKKGIEGNFGLGLSIIKKSLELMNYEISVNNEKKGVTFKIFPNTVKES